jgi:hypothetical protein
VQYRLALLDFVDGDIPRAALGFRRAFEAARGDGEVYLLLLYSSTA